MMFLAEKELRIREARVKKELINYDVNHSCQNKKSFYNIRNINVCAYIFKIIIIIYNMI